MIPFSNVHATIGWTKLQSIKAASFRSWWHPAAHHITTKCKKQIIVHTFFHTCSIIISRHFHWIHNCSCSICLECAIVRMGSQAHLDLSSSTPKVSNCLPRSTIIWVKIPSPSFTTFPKQVTMVWDWRVFLIICECGIVWPCAHCLVCWIGHKASTVARRLKHFDSLHKTKHCKNRNKRKRIRRGLRVSSLALFVNSLCASACVRQHACRCMLKTCSHIRLYIHPIKQQSSQ